MADHVNNVESELSPEEEEKREHGERIMEIYAEVLSDKEKIAKSSLCTYCHIYYPVKHSLTIKSSLILDGAYIKYIRTHTFTSCNTPACLANIIAKYQEPVVSALVVLTE